MKPLTLQQFLDGELGPAQTATFLAALPERERREALAMKRLVETAGRIAAPEPADDFVVRTMARVRARPAPRRTVWTWLRSPSISPLGALAAVAAIALLSVGGSLALRPKPKLAAAGDGARPQTVLARFTLRAPLAHAVSLAGDFNAWQPEATKLERGQNGVWTVEVPLPPGRHQYMFVVDGKQWVTDPDAPAKVDDGFGGENAVLEL